MRVVPGWRNLRTWKIRSRRYCALSASVCSSVATGTAGDVLQHQRQQLPIDGLVLHDQEQPLVVGRMKFDVAVGHFFKSFLKVNSINVI